MAYPTAAIEHGEHDATRAHPRPARASPQRSIRDTLAGLQSSLERYALVRVAVSLVKGFMKDRITNAAAAMTYYGIFSLFPLLLLFMALAGLALQSNEQAREQILTSSSASCPRVRTS